MGWRNAQASMVLVAEVNARWPRRDKSSDGTIGDAAHAARTSDHNPWLSKGGQGIVRARDVDKDGIDAPWIVEHLRQLGARRDPRLWPNGYVIFNRRITRPDFSGWAVYRGSNPHDKHFHVSFSTDASPSGFDSTAPWGIASPVTAAARPAASSSAPAQPAPQVPEDTEMIDNHVLARGRNDFRLIVPVGSASQLLARAWISVVGNGATVTGTLYVQNDQTGIRNFTVQAAFAGGHSKRWWVELPSGTTQVGVVLDAPAGGTVAVEAKPK